MKIEEPKKNNNNSIINEVGAENWVSRMNSIKPLFDENEFLSITPPFNAFVPLKLNSDLLESKSDYKLLLEVPGIKESEIDISIIGSTIEIKGTKQSSYEATKSNVHRAEISYGEFKKTINIPDNCDITNISASLDEGLLTITMPKTKIKTKKIEIKKQK